jgi:6-methylsalicylate decarboxylase
MMAGRIDVHNHFIPDFSRAATKAAGRRPATSRGLPAWSPESALAIMERYGIATAVLSISQPGVHYGDDGQAREPARQCNEYAAECARKWPARHLDGVVLFASCEERYLGDPFFDPVLEELDRRKAVAHIHPALHPKARELKLRPPLAFSLFPRLAS